MNVVQGQAIFLCESQGMPVMVNDVDLFQTLPFVVVFQGQRWDARAGALMGGHTREGRAGRELLALDASAHHVETAQFPHLHLFCP